MSKLRPIFSASILLLSMALPSMAIVGIGIHWGNDLTLNMDNVQDEQLALAGLSININSIDGQLPAGLTEISGDNLPVFINRTDWTRTPFNIGAKIFIDIIPILDVIELSTNFGLWEYEGSINYPTSLVFKENVNPAEVDDPNDLFDEPVYGTLPITLEEFDMGFLGLKKTPYMKLNFDLTVRKNIVQIPKTLKILKLYGGAGASVHFATPILNKGLIEDALGSAIEESMSVEALGSEIFQNEELSKKIIKEITSSLMTPHWGCHIDLGAMIKIPVMPVGFYVDGKLMIPFDNMDKNVDLGGAGFLLNTGICLSF